MPITASNFIELCQAGFYDGLHFHRVVPGFVNQFGCPHTKVMDSALVGSGRPPDGTFINLKTGAMEHRFKGCIKDEHISRDSNMYGTLSLASSGQPNSGGSQIYINVADNTMLDWFSPGRQHPVFGKIVEGMDVADKISKVRTKGNHRPVEPIVVEYICIMGLSTAWSFYHEKRVKNKESDAQMGDVVKEWQT